ncbi:MAG TPA: hypothetical protein VGR60_10205 [Gemmatimonadales bacterium]|nr:hypothetical protein [Gemmatimonadales bacterium]
MTGAAGTRGRGLLGALVPAWLIAGTLDIGIASTWYPLTAGAHVLRIYQGIASGILGARAFDGGLATAALGLACHYLIALIWTAIYFLAYPRLPLLRRGRSASAVLYGCFVSAAMTFIVLPLSNVGPRPFRLQPFVIATVILIIAIGTPLAILADHHYARRAATR